MTPRRALLAAFSSALLLGLAWGCSAADDSANGFSGGSGATGISEAGTDGQILGPGGASAEEDGGLRLNPLCGKAPSCVPDRPAACSSYVPPQGDANPDASFMEQAGASGAGGAGGQSVQPDPSRDGGAGGAAGEAGAGGAAGAAATPPPRFGCQVERSVNDAKSVVSECRVVGVGGANAPCLTASDCQAGFGCVGDQSAGLCQKYCCSGAADCDAGTYCAERGMRDATTNQLSKGSSDTSSALTIPVCVAAENCDLSAPYPCPEGTQCACKAGTACLVVRSDGTTTCSVPGRGKVGDACPCAWAHVCSAATNQCLKLCYTRGAASCGEGKCQSATELPDGWGVCVGSTPSGG